MAQYYSNPARENDPHALPNIEVFYAAERELGDYEDGGPYPAGWYWHSCFPGCLPDGDATGPFDSEEAALADARDEIERRLTQCPI